MSIYYLDSSVVAAVMLKEKSSAKWRKLLLKSELLYSSYLLEAEVFATATREKVPLSSASEFIERINLIIPKRSLREEYLQIFTKGYCRGADAQHLATALSLKIKNESPVFITLDIKQKKLAQKCGLRIK